MPAAARSLLLTDAYRARIVELRRRASGLVAASWTLDVDDLDASFLAWLARSDLIVTAAQAEIARLSDVYVAAYIGSELDATVAPMGLDTGAYAGTTLDGRPVRSILSPSLFTVKRGLADGRSFAEASKLGQARALRNATTEVDGAGDRALDDLLEQRYEIRGWRRVASGGACGACLGLMTGAIQTTARVLHRHPHCRCTKEPVVDGAGDPVQRKTGADLFAAMSPEEQNRLFAGRGGEAKAELIRSGKVELGDLVQETRFSLEGSKGGRFNRADVIITETPLARLLSD